MDAPPVTRLRRFGPPMFTVLVAAVALALVIPLLDVDRVTVAQPRIPLLVFFGLWALFEIVVLYLQFGKDLDNAGTIVVTEIPLALGLLFTTPADLLLVGVGTPVLIDLLRRRKSALKQAFNGVTHLAELGLALTLYRALDPSDPLSLRGWADLGLVVTVTGLFSSLVVSSVISLAIGRLPRRDFVFHVLSAVPVSLAAATIAIVAGLALQHGPSAVAPLLAALGVLLLLAHGFSKLTERHMDLASLHAFGQRLNSSRDVDAILATALDTSADLLMAREAEAYLPSPEDGTTLSRVRQSPDGGLTRMPVRRPDLPHGRGVLEDRGSVVSTAALGPGSEVVLSVTGRSGPMRPFGREDARLLDMVAHQTGPALHTAQLIDQLRHDTMHDPLTDLPNRRSLLETLHARVTQRHPLTVVWLGVRDVQLVNAALGHDHGDELLVQIGRRLQAANGPGAVVARVGGDEFAILMANGSDVSSESEQVATLLASLRHPFLVSGVQVVIRASAGVAPASGGPGVTATDLLRRADIAMRHARRTGRTVEHYTPALETATPERLALASDLQAGITRAELTLYAQPQVRLTDGVVTGAEALVRWNHPQLGLLAPGAFVPLAEQTGLDRPMTAWVLNAALKALAGWRATGLDVNVSVNVPSSALGDAELLDLTEELLTLRDVRGEHLVIEITESGLLENTTMAADVLRGLSALGVKVSIDDFGTGFSSLSHLRRLPVDEIKIDRSFVDTMLQDDDDAAIVRSVVDLGRDLGLACVAEGVERPEVYAALERLGCDSVQGYHLARPMPVDELAPWMRHRRSG
jgi:diguanylate cyclase (GGDEF)-like protein